MFAWDKVSVPVPLMVRLVPAPVRMESIVSAALLTVMTSAAAKVIVPPERTIVPEPEAKVMLAEFTVP